MPVENHFRQQHKMKLQLLWSITDYYGSMELEGPVVGRLPAVGSAIMCRFLTTIRDNLTRHWRTTQEQNGGAIFHAAEWVRARTQTAWWKLADDNGLPVSRPRRSSGWLASTLPGVPFGLETKETSMSKYRSVGHRYLSMCWRAHRIGCRQRQ